MCDGITIREMSRFLGKLFFISGDITGRVTIGSLKLRGYIPFLLAGFFASTPLWTLIRTKIKSIIKGRGVMTGAVCDLFLIAVLLLSVVFLMGGTYNPFIYFRF